MVATSYPRFQGDSSAVFLRYLARAMGGNGDVVHVLAPDDPDADDSLNDGNITVHRFDYFSPGGARLAYGAGILPNLRASRALYLQLPFFLAAFFLSMFLLARRVRPDVIHAHWIIPTGFIAIIVGRLLRIPVVTTAHGGDAFSLRSPFYRWAKRLTLNNSSTWTSNTRSTAAAAMSGGGTKAPDIVPMGVDVQLFASGNRGLYRAGLEEREQVILFVGRLVEKKGCEILINAFGYVTANYSGKVVLWIVGDGDERDVLENLVRNLGLSGKVRFFGKQPNENLPDIYAAADLFVLPSIEDRNGDTEGQGVVLLEAMASGVPIVASQVGGVEDVVKDRFTGWLLESTEPVRFGGRVVECLNSPQIMRVLADNARRNVMAYDWPVVAQHFGALYVAASG